MKLSNFWYHIKYVGGKPPHGVTTIRWHAMYKWLEKRFQDGDIREAVEGERIPYAPLGNPINEHLRHQ